MFADGRHIYTVTEQEVFRTAQETRELDVLAQGDIYSVWEDRDSITVATPGTLRRIEKSTGSSQSFVAAPIEAPRDMANDGESGILWVATQDSRFDPPNGGVILSVDMNQSRIQAVFKTETFGAVVAGSISVSGKWLAIADMEGHVFRLELVTSANGPIEIGAAIPLVGVDGYQVIVVPDGTVFVCNANTVSMAVVKDGSVDVKRFGKSERRRQIGLDPSRRFLASFGSETVQIWDLNSALKSPVFSVARDSTGGACGTFVGPNRIAYVDGRVIRVKPVDLPAGLPKRSE